MLQKSLKIAYIVGVDRSRLEKETPGALEKIESQARVMGAALGLCDIFFCEQASGILAKAVRRLPFIPDGIDWPQPQAMQFYDAIYIRRPGFISAELINFLSDVKASFPQKLILMELPTYPYDKEFSSLSGRPILAKDRYWRKKLHGLVDRIVDFSGRENIFSVETLQIHNGLEMTSMVPRKPSHSSDNALHIISVSLFSEWHGIDRILRGLAHYRKLRATKPVVLHLLGEGGHSPVLKQMTKDLELENNVVFYGQCKREKINKLYDKCSLAVASLGLHRIGIDVASTLKTREYLAKGMPFVYSGEIDVFQDEPVDFCLQVPADESPIDIAEIVRFHDRLYARESEGDLIARIRNYAERHVGMDAAMKPVIDYIKENCVDEK